MGRKSIAVIYLLILRICLANCEDDPGSKIDDAPLPTPPPVENESRDVNKKLNHSDESGNTTAHTSFHKYKYLFAHHRKSQLEAVKRILDLEDNTRRHDLVNMMLKQIFKVTEEAKSNVTNWGYLPGDPFPENKTILESVTKIYENTALFGDMVLRLPDVVHSIYDRKKDWQLLIAWAYGFCTQSNVFEGPNLQMLGLMAQEVKIIPEDPNYFNPYKAENKKKAKKMLDEKEEKEGKKKTKKKLPRGPRISRNEL